ncbi:MAG: hypothetical protein HY553_04135 [Elusimicrobia bacterium]|nr:hypothetical protein [Elusimicrobiota bacterium]
MTTFALALLLAVAGAEPTPAPSPSPEPSPAPAASPAPPADPAAAKPAAPAGATAPAAETAPAPAAKPAPKPAPTAAPEPGRVADGVIRFGQDIVLSPGQAVDGPVIALGGSVSVDGPIEGPVIAFGGGAKVGPRAVVEGPVISFGGSSSVDPAAKIDGPVLDLPGARSAARVLAPLATVVASLTALAVFGRLLAGLGWLVVGVVLYALFPDALRNTRDVLERKTAACAVWGLVAGPALACIALTFAASLIGLPLVPLVGMMTAAAYVWGTVALGYWIGTRAGEGRWESAVASIAFGLLALKLLGFVPVVRWLVGVATFILAVGAAFASRFGFRGPGLVTPVVPK